MKIGIVASLGLWLFCTLGLAALWAQAQPKPALKSITVYQDPG